MGRGDLTVPGRRGLDDPGDGGRRRPAGSTVGPFVLNVMNRHPAVVARMASTLQIASGGRLILGIGIGGAPKEHAAYGMDFPTAPERVARLEEAVAVIRALWTGGPVTRDSPFYPLVDAYAYPVPDPAAADHRSGGETPAGARLAGRIGDGWSTFDDNFEANLPLYLEALGRAGQAARGPDGPRRASRATGWATRTFARHAVVRGPARDLGALAGGRRRRRDRPGPLDRRRRRAGRGRRALVSPAGPSWHHRPRDADRGTISA